MNTEKILLFMTVNICQCEHCKEILRQQERLAKWQELNLLKPLYLTDQETNLKNSTLLQN